MEIINGVCALAKPLTLDASAIGSYKYGLINFMRTVKLTATFIDGNGASKFYTKTPTASDIVAGTSSAIGKTESQADIDGAASLEVDFVFNPDAFASAAQAPSCSADVMGAVVDPVHCVAFNVRSRRFRTRRASNNPATQGDNDTTMSGLVRGVDLGGHAPVCVRGQ